MFPSGTGQGASVQYALGVDLGTTHAAAAVHAGAAAEMVQLGVRHAERPS